MQELIEMAYKAIETTQKLIEQSMNATAFSTLLKAVQKLEHELPGKQMRRMFSRPGGSWEQMGLGYAPWKINEKTHDKLCELSDAIIVCYKSIPRDYSIAYGCYVDKLEEEHSDCSS